MTCSIIHEGNNYGNFIISCLSKPFGRKKGYMIGAILSLWFAQLSRVKERVVNEQRTWKQKWVMGEHMILTQDHNLLDLMQL